MPTPNDGISWLPRHFPHGFSVTFAREVEPSDLLIRMGCTEDSLEPLSREDAEEIDMDEDVRVIRAGFCDGWGYALQSWDAHILTEEGELMQRVSEGTEVVALISTSTIPWFAYCTNGDLICSFDPGTPRGRYGDDPDRFLQAMRQSGIAVDESSDRDPVAAMLEMAESLFHLRIPIDEAVRGDLLSGRID
ncbi:hypothetical protein HHL19_18965 [Streptomyces sp. R302]|uniref:DUF6461 domain-containing protein n=1 Tax=unclassified Streptomyces TaxID=2593676 RepID=UPI00145CCD91|nr:MULTISPECIES: DUF6461 domain-containing protein [unclassified Streptomyces]NML54739.1 hypothetical protein [Streptomyces sp. R301]NML80692.1 hypothetical protein [Streptomyces sp. R302]